MLPPLAVSYCKLVCLAYIGWRGVVWGGRKSTAEIIRARLSSREILIAQMAGLMVPLCWMHSYSQYVCVCMYFPDLLRSTRHDKVSFCMYVPPCVAVVPGTVCETEL